MSRRRLIVAVAAAQLVIIALLCLYIYTHPSVVFSISPLDKDRFATSSSGSFQHFFEPSLSTGVEFKMTHKPAWLAEVPQYRLNSDGINSATDFSLEKPEGTFRIVILGDSWTWGYLVSTRSNYSSKLSELLNGNAQCWRTAFEVINLGVPSYDLAYEVERFRTHGRKYDPDLVLWMIRDDDFSEPNEFLIGRSEKYLKEMQDKGVVPNMVYTTVGGGSGYVDDPKGKPMFSDPDTNRSIAARMKAIEDLSNELGVKGEMEYGEKQLAAFRELFTGPLVILDYPFMEGPKDVHVKVQEALRTFVSERPRTSLFHLQTDLKAAGAQFPELHPNEKGHDIIAREIYGYLTANHLVPCAGP